MSERSEWATGSTVEELLGDWLTQIGVVDFDLDSREGYMVTVDDLAVLVEAVRTDSMNNSEVVRDYVNYHCDLAVDIALADAASEMRAAAYDWAWTSEEVNDIADRLDRVRKNEKERRGG